MTGRPTVAVPIPTAAVVQPGDTAAASGPTGSTRVPGDGSSTRRSCATPEPGSTSCQGIRMTPSGSACMAEASASTSGYHPCARSSGATTALPGRKPSWSAIGTVGVADGEAAPAPTPRRTVPDGPRTSSRYPVQQTLRLTLQEFLGLGPRVPPHDCLPCRSRRCALFRHDHRGSCPRASTCIEPMESASNVSRRCPCRSVLPSRCGRPAGRPSSWPARDPARRAARRGRGTPVHRGSPSPPRRRRRRSARGGTVRR